MSNSPSQLLNPANARALPTRSAWRGILNLLTVNREKYVNVATLNRRNAVLTADALIRRLASSGYETINNHENPICFYCRKETDGENFKHAPGCLWLDANDFTAQDAVKNV